MQVPKFLRSREVYLSIVGILTLGLALFNAIAFFYDKDFTAMLYGDGINFDAPEERHARAQGTAFAISVEEESITLLKNEYNTLPLKDKKLNVFGYASSDLGFIHQGGGSGRTSDFAKESFYTGLSKAGIELNPNLTSFYNSFGYSRSSESVTASLQFRNYELSPEQYPRDFFYHAYDFSPIAAVVFSRPATEKLDIPMITYDRYGREAAEENTLALSPNEEYLLDELCRTFDSVIVILNSGNPMELPFYDDPAIGAILNVGYPGNAGCVSIGKVLTGEVNPSGRTVDTFVTDSRTNPAYINSSTSGNHLYNKDARYVDYAESVYVGYRYYETRFEENGNNEDAYKEVVAYPFGSGLSYTTFTWNLLRVNAILDPEPPTQVGDGDILPRQGKLVFEVWVENVGARPGSDVVELYCSVPYKRGEIEKSAVELVGFGKTSLLPPEKGELLEIEVPIRNLASYDCYDANVNGFIGYELDSGEYRFSFRHNAHDLHPILGRESPSLVFSVPQSGYQYPTDEVTNHPVNNLFTTFNNPINGVGSKIREEQSPDAISIDGGKEENISYLTRKDFKQTFPTFREDRPYTAEVEKTFPIHDPTIDPRDEKPTFESGEGLKIEDALREDFPYDHPIYDRLASCCSEFEAINLVQHAGFGTPQLASIGKPRCLDLDGPSGINTTVLSSSPGEAANYPSPSTFGQSWSRELCYEYGQSISKEAAALGVTGWYAPGANLHRSPLGGRNFEYFSEDPLLCGNFASYVLRGAKDGGVYSYVKHFAADETESGHNGQYHWMSEQALREIYAKPFEIAVKFGGANAIMLSKNRVGSVRACGSTALNIDLLRKEWGFKGAVITDYYVPGNVMDADECIRSGVDLILEGATVTFDEYHSNTFFKNIHRAARNAIYCYCHTMYVANLAQELPFNHLTGATNDIYPYWKPILIVTDIFLFPGLLLAGIFIVRHFKRDDDLDKTTYQ